ncbi:aminotransferase class I/II-fold pyridoxal phosphate-dependent enzyme [uncultured Litoreibacter sp.]|uniref:aminotransferase class I/II-fold pyridoxal phosphate-dependent enzyme n=1 Tax=uncultured Litoreibacter sp. TaxID=1392394 RepID=UPI0026365EA0|nr:aminotransferase class I/II-fold pyridoxal phosphate-dependent enzyme [uncultured Litoreibacter sp.]
MTYPERFSNLPPYAFPRLRTLLSGLETGGAPVDMTIGSPLHPAPHWIADIIAQNMGGFGPYPPNDGTPELRAAISDWIKHRYGVDYPADTQIFPLNGTREGLFNASLAICEEQKNEMRPVILTPNPFYQVYAVAALAVGAEPVYVPATRESGFLPDYRALPKDILNRTAVCYICSPSNPQGAVATRDYWADLIALAEEYDFTIFADECYSEIYREAQPTGALTIAAQVGANPERVMLFNSLSKRSNLAGLRSGFAASGPENIKRMKSLRNYAGAPLALPLQRVAEKIWADEDHVEANRALYREKLDYADELFKGVQGFEAPEAGFFLWLPVNNGEEATKKLWLEKGVKVLPGAYLGRDAQGGNPGEKYIRAALVAPMNELQPGLQALKNCIYG